MSTGESGVRTKNRYVLATGKNSPVVLHGYMSATSAENAWVKILTAYDLDGSNVDLREEFIMAMATLLIQGSSVATNYEDQIIVLEGREMPLSIMVSIVSRYTTQPNPQRVWLRSFRNAEVPYTAYLILNEPENREQRMQAMIRYKVPEDKVCYAFDMVEAALPRIEGAGSGLIALITAMKRVHLAEYHEETRSRGQNVALHDSSNRFVASANRNSGGGGGGPGDQKDRLGLIPSIR